MAQKGLILVVEANDLIRGLLERWLREAGYRVAFRAPPQSDEHVHSEEVPRLIIADIPRPRPGAEIVRRLRMAYACPLIALSARFRRGLNESGDAAVQIGAQHVLPKPFTREELLAAVQQAMAGER